MAACPHRAAIVVASSRVSSLVESRRIRDTDRPFPRRQKPPDRRTRETTTSPRAARTHARTRDVRRARAQHAHRRHGSTPLSNARHAPFTVFFPFTRAFLRFLIVRSFLLSSSLFFPAPPLPPPQRMVISPSRFLFVLLRPSIRRANKNEIYLTIC